MSVVRWLCLHIVGHRWRPLGAGLYRCEVCRERWRNPLVGATP
jgi:hypothetical protein